MLRRVSILHETVTFVFNIHVRYMSNLCSDNREKRPTYASVPFLILSALGYSVCKCAKSRETNICLDVCVGHYYYVDDSAILANET